MTLSDPRPRQPARRRSYLMDPANPVRPVNDQALTRVQQWIVSVLVVFTDLHLVVGLVVAAVMIDPSHQGSRIGLNLIAGAFGVIGVAGGFLVHRRNPLSPWLLLGLVPAAVGMYLVLR